MFDEMPEKELKEITVDYLTDYKKRLLARRERLMLPIQEVEQEIEHIAATIRSLQKPPQPAVGFTATLTVDFPIGKLRKLTQVQALTVIAKHYGGTFKAQEAKRLLIKAGVMRETKNSTNIIHAVIVRSEKFERVKPGEYRLKAARINAELKEFANREGLPFDEKPVQ
jgi:hypothetical protein